MSLGVLTYEMTVGDSPFNADDDDELFDQILRKKVRAGCEPSTPNRPPCVLPDRPGFTPPTYP